MISGIIEWVLVLITIEAITELIVDSKIFFKPRNWLAQKNQFLAELLSCGYCTSVWISFPFAVFMPDGINDLGIWWILIKWMVLHRLSNIIHEGFSRWLKRAPFVLVFQKISDTGVQLNDGQ